MDASFLHNDCTRSCSIAIRDGGGFVKAETFYMGFRADAYTLEATAVK